MRPSVQPEVLLQIPSRGVGFWEEELQEHSSSFGQSFYESWFYFVQIINFSWNFVSKNLNEPQMVKIIKILIEDSKMSFALEHKPQWGAMCIYSSQLTQVHRFKGTEGPFGHTAPRSAGSGFPALSLGLKWGQKSLPACTGLKRSSLCEVGREMPGAGIWVHRVHQGLPAWEDSFKVLQSQWSVKYLTLEGISHETLR